MARFHLASILHIRDIEIAGIVAHRGAHELAKLTKYWGIGEAIVYDSIAEMAEQVDVLAIFTPNQTRVAVMEEIAAAVRDGAELKGVICEKPLGRNLAEARRLVDLAAEAQLSTAYFENQLFMKAIRIQKTQLAGVEQQMGPLSLARSSEEHCGPHENWFWNPTRQGGGVLSDMGCHSIAVGRYVLTPFERGLTFLEPVSVNAEVGLLKWGEPYWRDKLLRERNVDYRQTPAEDFATGIITYRNPQTGQKVKAQFTNSWMFDKQGLRLLMDGMGPGYAFEINTLVSPLTLFIADSAAEAIEDAESALEKSTSSRGLLTIQCNEPDLYGYMDENVDALEAFRQGRDAMLPWKYGLEVTRLVMASYLSAERKRTVDLTDPAVMQELESYVPLIQQGRGAEQLY